MRRELFDYDLPEELIASRPAAERDGARLLVLEGDGAVDLDRSVRELDRLLAPGALLVVNDTRVVPARLLGRRRPSGGRAEIFLVRREADAVRGEGEGTERWRALGRASKPLRPGTVIDFDERGTLSATIEGKDEDDLLRVRLSSAAGVPIDRALEALGHVPLPPYIRRGDDADDRERYQTVFAREPGAVAAPTAGLHLTAAAIERLAARGVELATVTLHVGLGTFQPVTAEDLDQHRMHAEAFAVPAATAAAVDRARARGAPVVAVGTTCVRALESAADRERPGRVIARAGETRLLIQPGYRFLVVDELVTNFHLPQSTLLALVCALGGRERVLAAYRAAVLARFRFFSYGDAMLVRRPIASPPGGDPSGARA